MTDPASKSDKTNGNDAEPSITGTFKAWLKGLGLGRNADVTLQEELRELLESHEDANHTVDAEERMILMNLIKLGDIEVGDVMIPRADMIGIEVDSGLSQIIPIFREGLHSRVPVYRKTLDTVLGMSHIKDLLPYWEDATGFSLREILREVLFVPPSMPVLDLLLRMRVRRIHMAMVVDEFGGTDGLVTIEDLVEAVVGEIEDEHDAIEGPLIVEISPGVIEADARAPTEDVEAYVGLDFLPEDRDEDIDTIGGVVALLAGRVPQRGEVITHPDGVAFEVIEADARRIRRIRVRTTNPATGAAAPKSKS